jgi:hypothetical protein
LSVVPALAATGSLLARRPHQALALFATALLCEAVLCAALCFLLLWTDWGFDLREGLPVTLTGLNLLLAAAGQFVAALRGPRTYAIALAFAVGAVLVILAGTQVSYWLHLPPAWLQVLPAWHSLPVAVTSFPLAATAFG